MDVPELRGPYDVVNLATLFGMKDEHARAAGERTFWLDAFTRLYTYARALQDALHDVSLESLTD